MKYFYITTPIYYVNARPHIGHAYTTIASDTAARYHRLRGDRVHFLTGTDEHGDKIVKAAAVLDKTPQAYADEISSAYRQMWKKLDITNDDFIRTTEERHKKIVQLVMQKAFDSGDIYRDAYEGKYCFGCEAYLTDKELNEEGKCQTHLVVPETIREENYFFRLQKYLPRLESMLRENPSMVRPEQYYNEVLGTIQELKNLGEDLSVSRPKKRLTWGIELPFDENFVTYVWFDALLNYVSALAYPEGEQYQNFWPVARHMIGKDILKPHAIYWPCMLMAAGIPVYQQLFVHGYWLGFGDVKMSKSLGNALDPLALSELLGEDGLRYFLMREMNFGNDSRFSEELLQRRINTDLANDLGNLLQRTLSMIKKYFEGNIEPGLPEHAVAGRINELLPQLAENYHQAFEKFQFHRALEAVADLTRLLNQMIDETKPWSMAKENSPELRPLLQTLLKGIVVALSYYRPVLPIKSQAVFELLQYAAAESFPVSLGQVPLSAVTLTEWPVLFPRLELSAETGGKPAQ